MISVCTRMIGSCTIGSIGFNSNSKVIYEPKTTQWHTNRDGIVSKSIVCTRNRNSFDFNMRATSERTILLFCSFWFKSEIPKPKLFCRWLLIVFVFNEWMNLLKCLTKITFIRTLRLLFLLVPCLTCYFRHSIQSSLTSLAPC